MPVQTGKNQPGWGASTGAVGRREGQHEKELRAGDMEQKQLLSVILVLAFFQVAPTSP